MKYYCELNKTFYNTEEECCAAEQQILAAKSEEEHKKEEALMLLTDLKEEMNAAREKFREAYQYFVNVKKNYNDCAIDYARKHGKLPEGHVLTPDTIWNFFLN